MDNSPEGEGVSQTSLVRRAAGIGRSAVVRRAARRIAIVIIAIAARTLKALMICGVFVSRWRWTVVLGRMSWSRWQRRVDQHDRAWPIVVRGSGVRRSSASGVLPRPSRRRCSRAWHWRSCCRRRVGATYWCRRGGDPGRRQRRPTSAAGEKRQDGLDYRHDLPFMDWFSFGTSGYYRCVKRTFSTSHRIATPIAGESRSSATSKGSRNGKRRRRFHGTGPAAPGRGRGCGLAQHR